MTSIEDIEDRLARLEAVQDIMHLKAVLSNGRKSPSASKLPSHSAPSPGTF
ncbi:MAG TPA: hypothetical protein VGM32_03820 [Rhodopila sp.]